MNKKKMEKRKKKNILVISDDLYEGHEEFVGSHEEKHHSEEVHDTLGNDSQSKGTSDDKHR